MKTFSNYSDLADYLQSNYLFHQDMIARINEGRQLLERFHKKIYSWKLEDDGFGFVYIKMMLDDYFALELYGRDTQYYDADFSWIIEENGELIQDFRPGEFSQAFNEADTFSNIKYHEQNGF